MSEGDILIVADETTTAAPGGETAVPDIYENETADAGKAEDSSAENAEAPGTGRTQQVQTLTLTEDQKYTGDLILVNTSHAYDFEKNSELVSLVRISEAQTWSYAVDREEFMLAKRIMKSLDNMIHDCDQTFGSDETGVYSAYRSREYQQTIWDETLEEYGSEYTEHYVARPGYSEHHTGLALDLGIFYDDGSYGQFSGSEYASWMAANSWKYGFVRRYAEDKTGITGISNEAWHFRYVGIPHAAYMYEHNLCLEEYLDFLRDNTSVDRPLRILYSGESCSVYYTEEEVIPKPQHRYEISGDNRGGYIITVYS